jgi:hypothetical protein
MDLILLGRQRPEDLPDVDFRAARTGVAEVPPVEEKNALHRRVRLPGKVPPYRTINLGNPIVFGANLCYTWELTTVFLANA